MTGIVVWVCWAAAAQSKAEQEVVGRVLGEELEAVKQHAELLQDQMLRRIEVGR